MPVTNAGLLLLGTVEVHLDSSSCNITQKLQLLLTAEEQLDTATNNTNNSIPNRNSTILQLLSQRKRKYQTSTTTWLKQNFTILYLYIQVRDQSILQYLCVICLGPDNLYKVLIDLHFYSMKSAIEPANMILEFVGEKLGSLLNIIFQFL